MLRESDGWLTENQSRQKWAQTNCRFHVGPVISWRFTHHKISYTIHSCSFPLPTILTPSCASSFIFFFFFVVFFLGVSPGCLVNLFTLLSVAPRSLTHTPSHPFFHFWLCVTGMFWLFFHCVAQISVRITLGLLWLVIVWRARLLIFFLWKRVKGQRENYIFGSKIIYFICGTIAIVDRCVFRSAASHNRFDD